MNITNVEIAVASFARILRTSIIDKVKSHDTGVLSDKGLFSFDPKLSWDSTTCRNSLISPVEAYWLLVHPLESKKCISKPTNTSILRFPCLIETYSSSVSSIQSEYTYLQCSWDQLVYLAFESYEFYHSVPLLLILITRLFCLYDATSKTLDDNDLNNTSVIVNWNTIQIPHCRMSGASFGFREVETLSSQIETNWPTLYRIVHQWIHSLSDKATLQQIDNFGLLVMNELIKTGLLRSLMGMRKTCGSLSSPTHFIQPYGCIPVPRQILIDAFTDTHNTSSTETRYIASNSTQNKLTVGARAFCKHAHRSSSGWWGNATGTVAQKNSAAMHALEKIFMNVVWINLHQVPSSSIHHESELRQMLEIRSKEGYGMRWWLLTDSDRSISLKQGDINNIHRYRSTVTFGLKCLFRGFVEPATASTHDTKWRH